MTISDMPAPPATNNFFESVAALWDEVSHNRRGLRRDIALAIVKRLNVASQIGHEP
jgi:hypothetical protein